MTQIPNLWTAKCVSCFLISTDLPPLPLFLPITDLDVNFLSSPCSELDDVISNHRTFHRNVDFKGTGKILRLERLVFSDNKSATVARHEDGEPSCSQTRGCAIRDKMYITVSP